MRELLLEAAAEIEATVRHQYWYPDSEKALHPAIKRKYESDMGLVTRLRAEADRIRELESQQAASEPVAWCTQDEYGRFGELFATKADALKHSAEAFPLYAHPSAAAVTVTEAMVEAAWETLRLHCTMNQTDQLACDWVTKDDLVAALTAALTAASEGASV